jgi:putative hemolysin
MFRRMWIGLFVTAAAVLAACNTEPTATPQQAALPNPASVFCEENGGRLDLRTGAGGGVAGVCVFPDGSECDEWAYFREQCHPGESLVTPEAASTPVGEPLINDWKVYRDNGLGYRFTYPGDTHIETDDNPAHSLTIVGTEQNGERWPQITISHPADLPEFRPPKGVDLEAWLTDHSMLGDARLPDVVIAGITAVHVRHDRSPQSYAYDRYYFARDGQLYMIVIGHVGDREDWNLYNRFLDSFHFD